MVLINPYRQYQPVPDTASPPGLFTRLGRVTLSPLRRFSGRPSCLLTSLLLLCFFVPAALLLILAFGTLLPGVDSPDGSMRICVPFGLNRISQAAHIKWSCQARNATSRIGAVQAGSSVSTLSAFRYSSTVSASRPTATMAGTGAMGGLAHFLSAQKDAFLADVDSGRASGWVVAMGNEAGDLDSLASSIAYSVLSSALLETKAIPLLLTPHDLMDLRPENLLVLDQTQVSLSDLLHLDTLPASLMPDASAAVRSPGVGLTNAKVEYALVDHNRLMPEFGPGKVVAVIDHHEDEHAHDDAPVKYVQVPTGSCASLVTKHFMRQWQAAIPAQGGADSPVPPELATLLLAAILIDTNGLKRGGKAVSTDYEAAHFLFPLSAYSRPSSSTSSGDDVAIASEVSENSVPEALSNAAKELKAKKFDVSKLSTMQLLMRDYKDYRLPTSSQVFPSIQAGLATVPLALKEWLVRDNVGGGGQTGWAGFLADSDAYMAKRGLDVLGVLTSFKSDKGKDKREAVLLVRYGLDGCAFADEETGRRVMDQLVAGFEADQVLLLENWKDKSQPAGAKRISREALDSQHRFGAVWKQGNAEATRKQFAPVLRHLVSALS